jgi:transposase InsO family protein
MELVTEVLEGAITPCVAARAYGISVPSVRKWVGRYLAQGEAGLVDRSSRPQCSPRAISAAKILGIVELRRRRLTHARIAASLGVSKSTVGRVLRRAGLSRLRDLQPCEPVVRYEHEFPGDLVHIDTKKLGRIERMGHRVTGDPRDNTNGAGWEFLFVAVDDHARIGFTDLYLDERHPSAMQFLQNTVAYFRSLGVRVRRILTDNASVFRSKPFAAACRALRLKHSFTRAYRPQTNGKAERLVRTLLAEWAYARPFHSTAQRQSDLVRYLDFYNHRRPHWSLAGQPPISRAPVNNLGGKNS